MVKVAKEQEIERYLALFAEHRQRRSGGSAAWRKALSQNALETFEKLGFPTPRHEDWKYTNVAPIARTEFSPVAKSGIVAGVGEFAYSEAFTSRLVFVDGIFNAELTDISGIPAGIIAGNLGTSNEPRIEKYFAKIACYDTDAFAALNTAFVDDGAFVFIPRGRVIESPIHLLFISTAPDTVSHPRVLLIADEGSIATLIESYTGTGDDSRYFTNAVTEIVLGQDASLTHYRVQDDNEEAFHIGTSQVNQEKGSRYASYCMALGGKIARHTLTVNIDGEGCESIVDGLYIGIGSQHIDNHTTIDHRKPNSASHQLYKGILSDSARAVFNGRILVQRGALLTDAKQLNKNLLLSKESHVDTKPQLEIFADDVKCAHGATVGQLEDDEIFYLLSRGLTPEVTRSLLTYGFAEDVLSKINVRSLRHRLEETVLERLNQKLEIA